MPRRKGKPNAKIRRISLFSKFSARFFIQRPARRRASFPKAGAKVRLITGSANLSRLFLEGSAKILCKRLIYKYVIKQGFHGRKRRDKEGTHYIISGGRALRARITITVRGKGHTISAYKIPTEREQGAHGMKTGCEQKENSA